MQSLKIPLNTPPVNFFVTLVAYHTQYMHYVYIIMGKNSLIVVMISPEGHLVRYTSLVQPFTVLNVLAVCIYIHVQTHRCNLYMYIPIYVYNVCSF